MKTCPSCSRENGDDAPSCARCGLSLLEVAPPGEPTDEELAKRGKTRCVECGRIGPASAAHWTGTGLRCPTCFYTRQQTELANASDQRLATGKPVNPLWAIVVVICLVPGAFVLWVWYRLTHGSCPHVYAFDGVSYQLDADPLSGAFLRAAERDDLVRLDHARPAGGRYRLEIRDELPEKDAIDAIELVVVDHDPSLDVLPTQDGAILGVARAAAPTAARDGAGADRLAAVVTPDDGAFVAADADPAAGIATLELSFSHPEGAASLALALRAHATPFAEEAFARYLAAMGPGLAPLLEWADDDSDQDFRDRIQVEMRRMGLPLAVEVDTGRGFQPVVELRPVGPAVQRTQAVPLPELPPGPVHVRLRWTPRFWAVDAALLGAVAPLAPAVTRRPILAAGPGGPVLDRLRAADGDRVVLSQGERIALEIEAPPGPSGGLARTALLRIRGYYEMDHAQGRWINPGVLLAHVNGTDSLPRFAARLARARPDLVADGVR